MDRSFYKVLILLFVLLSSARADDECEGKPDETMIPIKEDCTKFHLCSDGELSEPNACPEGLFFSEAEQTCVLSDEHCFVETTTEEITTTTEQITTTTEEITTTTEEITTTTEEITTTTEEITTTEIITTTTDLPVHEDCKDIDNSEEFIFFPSKIDCASYYFCYDGQPQEMTCLSGMYWNQALQRCDWSGNVECSITTTTELPTTTAVPEICPESDVPVFVPSTTDCGQYYLCYKGTPQLLTCTEHMHWNQATLQCDYPTNVDCEISLLPKCPETGVVFFPHPQKCTQYISCSYGKQTIVNCPFSEIWDIVQNKCMTESLATCILD